MLRAVSNLPRIDTAYEPQDDLEDENSAPTSGGEKTPTQQSISHVISDIAGSASRAEPQEMTFEGMQAHCPPTGDQDVKNAVDTGSKAEVTLWRGSTAKQREDIARYGTAGGVPEQNPNIGRPSEAEARAQAGGGSFPHAPGGVIKLPEYTASMETAKQFSGGKQVFAIKVGADYLTRGSTAEQGWTAHSGAPVKLLGFARVGNEDDPEEAYPDAG